MWELRWEALKMARLIDETERANLGEKSQTQSQELAAVRNILFS
jgi:hypothetical protein